MPDQESQEPIEGSEEAIYDEAPPEEVHDPQADLAQALQPTEEHFAPFAPEPDPPSIEDEPQKKEDPGASELAFDPRMKEPFEGLMFVGSLSKRFTWAGHRFEIRTLMTEEILEVGMVHRPYVGTLAEMKAYQAATVAACLVSVDDKPLPTPITNDPDDTLLGVRFSYVIRKWSPLVMDVVYSQYLALEQKVNEVLVAMGKASG